MGASRTECTDCVADRLVLETLRVAVERVAVTRSQDLPCLLGCDVRQQTANHVVGIEEAVRLTIGQEDPHFGVDDQQLSADELADQRAPEIGRLVEALEVQGGHGCLVISPPPVIDP